MSNWHQSLYKINGLVGKRELSKEDCGRRQKERRSQAFDLLRRLDVIDDELNDLEPVKTASEDIVKEKKRDKLKARIKEKKKSIKTVLKKENKPRPFVVGVVRHKLHSPPFLHGPLNQCNKQCYLPATPKSFAPKNYKFKGPLGLRSVNATPLIQEKCSSFVPKSILQQKSNSSKKTPTFNHITVRPRNQKVNADSPLGDIKNIEKGSEKKKLQIVKKKLYATETNDSESSSDSDEIPIFGKVRLNQAKLKAINYCEGDYNKENISPNSVQHNESLFNTSLKNNNPVVNEYLKGKKSKSFSGTHTLSNENINNTENGSSKLHGEVNKKESVLDAEDVDSSSGSSTLNRTILEKVTFNKSSEKINNTNENGKEDLVFMDQVNSKNHDVSIETRNISLPMISESLVNQSFAKPKISKSDECSDAILLPDLTVISNEQQITDETRSSVTSFQKFSRRTYQLTENGIAPSNMFDTFILNETAVDTIQLPSDEQAAEQLSQSTNPMIVNQEQSDSPSTFLSPTTKVLDEKSSNIPEKNEVTFIQESSENLPNVLNLIDENEEHENDKADQSKIEISSLESDSNKINQQKTTSTVSSEIAVAETPLSHADSKESTNLDNQSNPEDTDKNSALCVLSHDISAHEEGISSPLIEIIPNKKSNVQEKPDDTYGNGSLSGSLHETSAQEKLMSPQLTEVTSNKKPNVKVENTRVSSKNSDGAEIIEVIDLIDSPLSQEKMKKSQSFYKSLYDRKRQTKICSPKTADIPSITFDLKFTPNKITFSPLKSKKPAANHKTTTLSPEHQKNSEPDDVVDLVSDEDSDDYRQFLTRVMERHAIPKFGSPKSDSRAPLASIENVSSPNRILRPMIASPTVNPKASPVKVTNINVSVAPPSNKKIQKKLTKTPQLSNNTKENLPTANDAQNLISTPGKTLQTNLSLNVNTPDESGLPNPTRVLSLRNRNVSVTPSPSKRTPRKLKTPSKSPAPKLNPMECSPKKIARKLLASPRLKPMQKKDSPKLNSEPTIPDVFSPARVLSLRNRTVSVTPSPSKRTLRRKE